MLALEKYDECSVTLKNYMGKKDVSNYQIKLERLIRSKMSKERKNKGGNVNKIIHNLDNLLIADIYDWNYFLYSSDYDIKDKQNQGSQNVMSKQEIAEDSLFNYKNIYDNEMKCR